MGMAKKGSRKIDVDGTTYRWRVSHWRQVSDWQADAEFLDERFLQAARQFGLGDVAAVLFHVVIERHADPRSRITAKYHSFVVDGFLGFEQLAQIKPGFVAGLIRRCLGTGWDPAGRSSMEVEIFERVERDRRDAVLLSVQDIGQPIPPR
jgi:hypothetical protein